MIQCRYCGRWCGCRFSDPCVCMDECYDCDVEPDETDDITWVIDDDFDDTPDYDDGGES